MLKKILYFILTINLLIFTAGLYFQYIEKNSIYNKIMGSGVLLLVFVLLPLFLYYRYKDKNIDDYRFKGFNDEKNEK